MTLQSSGAITMSQIHAEFRLGYSLGPYRGATWYTDSGTSGTFASSSITMSGFYSKRASDPASISTYFNPSSAAFPSTITVTFYWTVSGVTPGTPVSVTIYDGNGSTLYSNPALSGSGSQSVTFSIGGTGSGTASLPTHSKTSTSNITVTPPAGISIAYPTLVTHGSGFTWSLTGGYPSETCYISWSGAASGSTSVSLDASGNYNNGGSGDFGTSYGSITNVFTFSKSSGSFSKTVSNQPPFPTVNYPSSTSHYPATFSWSISGGLASESWSVTWSGANSGSYSSTLDSSGSAYFSGSYYVNTGTVYLTFTFASGYRVSTSTIYTSINVTVIGI